MSFYFDEDPKCLSKPLYFETFINHIKLKINSDSNVFSNKYIDFGTWVLLNSFSGSENYKSILDLGCGYGVIGIYLKKIYPDASVLLVDINERAINLSKLNIKENDVECNVYKSDGFKNVFDKFDLICLNPPIRAGKKIYYQMYKDAKNHLNTNGELRIVIQKKQGALSTFKELENIFGNCSLVLHKKGYQIYKSVLTN